MRYLPSSLAIDVKLCVFIPIQSDGLFRKDATCTPCESWGKRVGGDGRQNKKVKARVMKTVRGGEGDECKKGKQGEEGERKDEDAEGEEESECGECGECGEEGDSENKGSEAGGNEEETGIELIRYRKIVHRAPGSRITKNKGYSSARRVRASRVIVSNEKKLHLLL